MSAAKQAAKWRDLVLFCITGIQGQANEAEWNYI